MDNPEQTSILQKKEKKQLLIGALSNVFNQSNNFKQLNKENEFFD